MHCVMYLKPVRLHLTRVKWSMQGVHYVVARCISIVKTTPGCNLDPPAVTLPLLLFASAWKMFCFLNTVALADFPRIFQPCMYNFLKALASATTI